MQQTDLTSTAQDAVAQSKSFLTKQLDERSTQIGERVGATADDLRRIGTELQSSTGVGGAAALANRGADYIERIGTYLRESNGDELIADLEDFARERPWAIAGAAVVAGLAASRFVKSSSIRRYRSYGTTYAY